MDHVFSPWRYAYVTSKPDPSGCVLCGMTEGDGSRDEAHLVVARARHHFVVLNLYPYTSGHLMVVPFRHVARLSDLSDDEIGELGRLVARAEVALGEAYRPEGLNIGINLGRAAGAGIADHLHVHIVPRWVGDTSFVTVTGETRVLPEDLRETWRKLRSVF